MVRTFKKEIDYADWFREHLEEFGYTKVLVEPHHPMFAKPFPDYWCVKKADGTLDRIELELFPSCFIEHSHDIAKVDYIYCADDDRVFFLGFPKEISVKIVITDTRAYKEQRCMKALEERCKRALKTKNLDYLILSLSWTSGESRECMICGIPIPERVTRDVRGLHSTCAEKVIKAFKEDRLNSLVQDTASKQ